jgi:hypothetical protein
VEGGGGVGAGALATFFTGTGFAFRAGFDRTFNTAFLGLPLTDDFAETEDFEPNAAFLDAAFATTKPRSFHDDVQNVATSRPILQPKPKRSATITMTDHWRQDAPITDFMELLRHFLSYLEFPRFL